MVRMSRRLPDEYFRPSGPGDVAADAHTGAVAGEASGEPGTGGPRLRRWRVDIPVKFLVVGVIVAFFAGLAIGRVAADESGPEPTAPISPTDVETSATPTPTGLSTTVPYDGAVRVVPASRVTGKCEGGTGHDVPANLLDGDPDTIWRCAGSGVGAQLTFLFEEDTQLVGVRLVNGDTVAENRFLEERRIVRVKWEFPEGEWVVQGFAANDPTPQEIRFPPVAITGPVTMTVEASTIAGDTAPTFDAISISSLAFLSDAPD